MEIYTSIFNYYENIKDVEFEKFLFLNDNISENINQILNKEFKGKYPNIIEWEMALLSIEERFENNKNNLS